MSLVCIAIFPDHPFIHIPVQDLQAAVSLILFQYLCFFFSLFFGIAFMINLFDEMKVLVFAKSACSPLVSSTAPPWTSMDMPSVATAPTFSVPPPFLRKVTLAGTLSVPTLTAQPSATPRGWSRAVTRTSRRSYVPGRCHLLQRYLWT